MQDVKTGSKKWGGLNEWEAGRTGAWSKRGSKEQEVRTEARREAGSTEDGEHGARGGVRCKMWEQGARRGEVSKSEEQ